LIFDVPKETGTTTLADRKSKNENRKCLTAIPVQGIPEIRPGDSLPDMILEAARAMPLQLAPGDILVVTHKVVSKSEGQLIALAQVRPRVAAAKWAARHGYDARVVELAMREGTHILRQTHGVLITQTRHGWICANSGVDVSNVDGGRSAALLPLDADASAQRIYRALKKRLGFAVPIIITDTFGRPWREGLAEAAIGLAGMKAFRDYRDRRDVHGYKLRVSLEAAADELAGMAGLACGKLTSQPACVIRGFQYTAGTGRATDLIRPAKRDLFR
jgi:coenzyme F420-0:L-glutamate ligase/coenzyme F420-1:gamma-L-glutamate ligase